MNTQPLLRRRFQAHEIYIRYIGQSRTESSRQNIATAKKHAPTQQPSDRSPEETAPKRNLYAPTRGHQYEEGNEKLKELWDEATEVPEWVDWEQIDRGQQVFYSYAGIALTAQSILGGMGAGRITEVLARPSGFSTKVAKHRLYKTNQHILQVTKSLESIIIKHDGAGHRSSIHVRLLHAAVRRRIMKLAAEKPSYYSASEYGVPINDLDSIGTIATFSLTLVWPPMPGQGIFLRAQETADYIALWHLIAHYLDTPTDNLTTPQKAHEMMESIFVSEIRPTETGKGQPPAYASRDFLNASAIWLNAKELSDAFGLVNWGWFYFALVAWRCIFFCGLGYTYRSFEYLDKMKIAKLRKLLYAVIVENKEHGLGSEINFEFKYIPNYDLTATEPGEYEGVIRDSGVK
ncbi:hypothetical protein BJ878DRAFT_531504 [Calycina marina]|uniref:ER-bound oxygenase mpaB/mpaB'/Rubber oxygenase catalytic domain-containing protein n=1 Tax=Calycina marina TaxID=1763456 RepID=A0A9P7ZBF7_9HELO|nr:hypothetical protein BJ878DRAFT_531504 [Calycina marina]